MTWCSMYGGVGGCGCVLEIKLNIYPDLIIFISYAHLVLLTKYYFGWPIPLHEQN